MDVLSPRELEVLNLMAKGYSHPRIARELQISYKTVRSHANHIYTKLYVSNGTEAVVKGHLLGLVRLKGLSPIALAIVQLLQVQPGALDELVEAGLVKRNAMQTLVK